MLSHSFFQNPRVITRLMVSAARLSALLGICCAPYVFGQVTSEALPLGPLGPDDPIPTYEGPALQPTEGVPRLTNAAFPPDEPAIGVPYRALFRTGGSPLVRNYTPGNVGPSVHTDYFRGRITADLPEVVGRFGLFRQGFEPEDADLKIGPMYFKLRALTLGAIYSDNVNRSATNVEEDVIGIARIGASIVVQLTETLQLSTTGNFIWLPFEGTAGISGFRLIAPYNFAFEGIPSAQAQLSWDTKIAGWDVRFEDFAQTNVGRYNIGQFDEIFLFDGGQYDDQDRAGRYIFRAPIFPNDRDARDFDRTDFQFSFLSNVVSVTAQKLLPGDWRVRARLEREDLWYNSGRRGLPQLRESAFVRVSSERVNLRFKPFIQYRATRIDTVDGVFQSILAGVNGPITENMSLQLAAGFFIRSSTGGVDSLYRLIIAHTLGPYTRHSLSLVRDFDDFTQELTTAFTYRITQVLGPKLVADAFVSRVSFDDQLNEGFDREGIRVGLRLTADLGPRTFVRLVGTYDRTEFVDDGEQSGFGNFTTYTGRAELNYRWTDTTISRLYYQYQKREADIERQSFVENAVFLTVTKYFQ